MAKQMYQVTCLPECEFMLRSHDKDEVKRLAKEHVKTMHKTEDSDAEIEKNIKETRA
jgi:predicted small metal-binding protein